VASAPVASAPVASAPVASAPVAHASTNERSYSVERFYTLERGLSGQGWAPLPGTRREAEAIQQLILQAQVFVGAEASKERLLHLAAPRILHIATHGFFLEDRPVPSEGRGLGEVGPVGASPWSMPDPLLRSGLVLAGAGAPEDLSDSLVTALELAGIDLLGTELVVLSACDTGRGDVKLGQGVYGLRRALVIAGAETVVVSLWRVDDETTRSMMESYYRNLLAGQGRTAALRKAMLSLRDQHPHPHFWAPFIAIGRDAPLQALAVEPARRP
jgi:CHAT domain-containing protein